MLERFISIIGKILNQFEYNLKFKGTCVQVYDKQETAFCKKQANVAPLLEQYFKFAIFASPSRPSELLFFDSR